MTKIEAILTLMREGLKDRGSKTGLRAVRRACMVLELTQEETQAVEAACEYRNGSRGELYPPWQDVK